MGDAVRGGVEVEERGVVCGGRCAADTDTDGALRGNREWRGSCDPLCLVDASRRLSLSAAETNLRRTNRVSGSGANARRTLTSGPYFCVDGLL